jgi:hypothetical protein
MVVTSFFLLEKLSDRMCHQGFCLNFIKHLLCRWPSHCNFDLCLVHHGHAAVHLHRPLNIEPAENAMIERKAEAGVLIAESRDFTQEARKESRHTDQMT